MDLSEILTLEFCDEEVKGSLGVVLDVSESKVMEICQIDIDTDKGVKRVTMIKILTQGKNDCKT